MCRVSTQITGKPTSARALNSHCDSGPASNPIRLKRSMEHFAGLDVSVKETSVCIVDDTGKIVREVKVASEPDALLAELRNPAHRFSF
jgi:hypothetical protein